MRSVSQGEAIYLRRRELRGEGVRPVTVVPRVPIAILETPFGPDQGVGVVKVSKSLLLRHVNVEILKSWFIKVTCKKL